MRVIRSYVRSFFELFYPNLCIGCEQTLVDGENHLCTSCLFALPKTNYESLKDNPVEKSLWGRAEFNAASSFLSFSHLGITQKIIHSIKYSKAHDAAIHVGFLMGQALKESSRYHSIDCIIPIPLHPKKLRRRGYNQSHLLSEGISKALEVEVINDQLKRTKNTSTQTRKSRIERYKNVQDIFEVDSSHKLDGKHILLVDDVITTGSTMEAAIQAFDKIENIQISLASLAHADV